MQLVVQESVDAMSRLAAQWIVQEIQRRRDLLLVAASGGTPTPVYEQLGQLAAREPGLFRELRIAKLDEWGGLAMDDPASCECYLQKHLVQPLRLDHQRYWGFRSDPADAQAECRRIQERLEAEGPIDICVLGLGLNGHVGFNEPGAFLHPFAHIAELSEASLQHPMLQDARGSATFGMTLGMADLLCARRILLLVCGSAKQEALQRLMCGRIRTDFPASLLWLHPNATCLCDREAALPLLELDANRDCRVPMT